MILDGTISALDNERECLEERREIIQRREIDNMKKITEMMKMYIWKLGIRVLIFALMLTFYVMNKELLCEFVTQNIWIGLTPIHLLWFVFMVMMLRHLFFPRKATMALRKAKEVEYEEKTGYDRLALLEYVQDQNIKAWKVMLIWLSFNAIFGVLYLLHLIDNADLLMLTVFFFLCDYICILFYCPFQTEVMKNKCCVNCRIYDWGHFMMFTPMLFIKSFFSWSLFFTALVVLIRWELIYAKYPERFWSGSNQKLNCAHCNDKICKFKYKKIHGENAV